MVLGYTGYFAELVDEWALEGDPSARLFRLGASVSAAAVSDVPVEKLARYFEYWLLRLQGVYPSVVGVSALWHGSRGSGRGESRRIMGRLYAGSVSPSSTGQICRATRWRFCGRQRRRHLRGSVTSRSLRTPGRELAAAHRFLDQDPPR